MNVSRAHVGGQTVLAVTLAAAPVSVRAATPMSYLHSAGARADPVTSLIWGLITLSVAVVAIIGLLVVVGVLQRRRSAKWQTGETSDVVRGGGSALMRWVYGGLIATTVVLAGFVTWTMSTLASIRAPAKPPLFTIEIIGHQWWWEARYLASDPSRNFTTANEIHVPVGEPVRLRLSSADVIHSFWIPALSGKTDLIPGRINETWIEADRAGDFRGQCAEFCGQQHAHMALRAVAQPTKEFEAWWNRQLQPAAEPASPHEVQQGKQLFTARCGICHTVSGTLAGGKLGPDLSHLMGRAELAANILPNNPATLSAWISAPQRLKPHSKMPNPELSGPQLQAIRQFLLTLH